MVNLADTVARLAAIKKAMSHAQEAGPSPRLTELVNFGTNPGALKGWAFAPAGPRRQRPLVVVLHGCTQTAAGYDLGTGWSALAEREGFAVLYPEQQRANNPNLCFNWFDPGDTRRGAGEVASIRQMIAAIQRDANIDPSRIYVTGLSAGGGMASAMLATYPELFAGGAIIAGLPFGVAAGVPQAFTLMGGQGIPDPASLDRLLRQASSHSGPWPRISIWHGTDDRTVNLANADAIAAQWRGVHHVPNAPSTSTTAGRVTHRVWVDAAGRPCIEEFRIAGMGHGTPVEAGSAGPFLLDVGIASTAEIARSWGLSSKPGQQPSKGPVLYDDIVLSKEMPARDSEPSGPRSHDAQPKSHDAQPKSHDAQPKSHEAHAWERLAGSQYRIGKVIEDALRKAGLMK